MATFYRREVLKDVFVLLWRKKYLWFFGFFIGVFYIIIRRWTPPYVSLGDELDIVYNSLLGDFNPINGFQAYLNAIRESVLTGELSAFFDRLQSFFTNNAGEAIGLVLAFLAVFFLILWLATIAQGAIVYVTLQHQAKQPVSFIDAIAVGAQFFWKILTAVVIGGLFSLAIWVILVGLPAVLYFLNGNEAWRTTTVLGSLLITLPVSLIISFLTKFIMVSIVQENLDFGRALRKAWTVFRPNWLVSLEFSVILFAINTVLVYVVVSSLVFIIFPRGWSEFWTINGVLFLLFAYIRAFNLASWALVYLRLQEGRGQSRIGYWTSKLTSFVETKKPANT